MSWGTLPLKKQSALRSPVPDRKRSIDWNLYTFKRYLISSPYVSHTENWLHPTVGTDSGQVGNPNTLWHTAEINDGKDEAAQGMMQRKGGDCIPDNPAVNVRVALRFWTCGPLGHRSILAI